MSLTHKIYYRAEVGLQTSYNTITNISYNSVNHNPDNELIIYSL